MSVLFHEPQWQEFLAAWNSEFLSLLGNVRREELFGTYSHLESRFERRWLGEKAATAEEIQLVESRLAITIPGDYASFLRVSNGWTAPGFESYDHMISPVAEIDRYVLRNPESAKIYLEEQEFYFRSGEVDDVRQSEFLRRVIGLCDQSRFIVLLFDPDAKARQFWHANFHDTPRVFSTFTELVLFERERCKERFAEVLEMFE